MARRTSEAAKQAAAAIREHEWRKEGAELREVRRVLGLTLQAMADRLGLVRRQAIQEAEAGRRGLPGHAREKFAELREEAKRKSAS